VEIPLERPGEPQRLVVLGTGGTIAGRALRAEDNVGYTAGQVPVQALLAGIPGAGPGDVEVEQVAQLDSKDMVLAVWQALTERVAFHLARPEVAAVVVTHGTDTLEETALVLQHVLQPAKPVVLTCAMRPATALAPDGPQNLADAFAVARHPGASGVLVVCAGEVHGAAEVVKTHTYRLDAFDSGDAGPMALVVEGAVRHCRPWPVPGHSAFSDPVVWRRWRDAPELPRVGVVMSHADADGWQVDALLGAGPPGAQAAVRGIVVAGTGNATVHARLEQALLRAQAQGVRVVRITRCARGPVVPHAGQALGEAWQLSPAKARLALALELLAG
jgi:L-asparaginase